MTHVAGIPVSATTPPLPIWRLNGMRVLYALLVFGLGSVIWPGILDPSTEWTLARGEVVSMLAAMALLALLGLRYPVQMLPLLFFELAWKPIWLLRVALPLWAAHRIDDATTATMYECAGVLLLYALLPWRYIVQAYGARLGDPWLGRRA
jgi:hypothetical protein